MISQARAGLISLERAGALLEALPAIARRAGDEIMRVYTTDFAVRGKSDDSPVTEADEAAERIILEALAALTPGMAAISEEACSAHGIPEAVDCHWLVDPLDGTREFVQKNGEFTVNIALVDSGAPILGVVYAPVLDVLYAGAMGIGAWREKRSEKGGGTAMERHPIYARRPPDQGLTVLASRSFGDEAALQVYLAQRSAAFSTRVAQIKRVGSSLKLGVLAAGEADLYPRFGRTMEWDIAAGHAVLAAAGGHVLTLEGAELAYGKPGCDNPDFVATGATVGTISA